MVLTPWPLFIPPMVLTPWAPSSSRHGPHAVVPSSWPDGPHPLAPSPFGRGGTAPSRRGARGYAPARVVLVPGGGAAAGIFERWIHSGTLNPRRNLSSRVSC